MTRYPETPNVHYAYGVFLLVEQPDKAIEEFKRELQIQPNHAASLMQIAYEYLKKQRRGGAAVGETGRRGRAEFVRDAQGAGRGAARLRRIDGAIKELETGRGSPPTARARTSRWQRRISAPAGPTRRRGSARSSRDWIGWCGRTEAARSRSAASVPAALETAAITPRWSSRRPQSHPRLTERHQSMSPMRRTPRASFCRRLLIGSCLGAATAPNSPRRSAPTGTVKPASRAVLVDVVVRDKRAAGPRPAGSRTSRSSRTAFRRPSARSPRSSTSAPQPAAAPLDASGSGSQPARRPRPPQPPCREGRRSRPWCSIGSARRPSARGEGGQDYIGDKEDAPHYVGRLRHRSRAHAVRAVHRNARRSKRRSTRGRDARPRPSIAPEQKGAPRTVGRPRTQQAAAAAAGGRRCGQRRGASRSTRSWRRWKHRWRRGSMSWSATSRDTRRSTVCLPSSVR